MTALNDQGFHFRVHPPVMHTSEHGPIITEDTEALVICFETASGSVFMNIALRYNVHKSDEHVATAGRIGGNRASGVGLRASGARPRHFVLPRPEASGLKSTNLRCRLHYH